MKCANCGADIPAGMLICPDCGTEVQMVPDYNPLDDVLTREVKGSVEDVTRPLPNSSGHVQQQRNRSRQQPQNSTRVLSQGELDRIRSNQMRTSQKSNYRGRDTVGEERIRPTRRDTRAQQTDYRTADERRRQKALRMRQAKKKRRNTMIVVMVILVAVGISGILLYQNSYSGTLNKAEKAYQSSEYSKAIRYYNLAIAKDNTRATAYVGLSKVYIAQDELDKAENMFLNAIDSQPENADLYEALAQFYIKTDQADKISGTLDGSSKNVLKEMSDYVSDMPEFSLEEGTYTEVQQVSLSGNGKIYYTTDGNEPTTDSTLYTEPILIEDGTVVIKAICVNKKGIPSLVATKTYQVEIPIEDAPAVTPSTGQYTSATEISITVPEGYTAYYTMDNTTPTTASTQYTGPIDMPEGQTIFSAILVNKNGKTTQVTKRNYVLNLQ